MGIAGSSSVADSSSVPDSTDSDEKTIERVSAQVDASMYFSRAEREILETVYRQLSLSIESDTFDNNFILTLGSHALEAMNSPQIVEQNIPNNWQADDVEDLLSQIKLSSLHEEKKKSFLQCLEYLEKEVFPVDLGKYLLYRSSSTSAAHILSSQDNFNHFVSAWLGRQGDEGQKLNFIFELAVAHHQKQSPSESAISIVDSSLMVDCYGLLDLFYRFAFAEAILRRYSHSDLSTLSPLPQFQCLERSHFLVKSLRIIPSVIDGNISMNEFEAWCRSNCPNMLSSVYRVMNYIFFPPIDAQAAPHSLLYFDSNASESSFFTSSVCPTLYALACTSSVSPSLFQGLHRLYSSSSDGLSWAKVEHSIVGYNGPTLFFIKVIRPTSPTHRKSQEYIVGAYAGTAWKKPKAPDFFGDDQCFLFQLEPSFKVIKAQHRRKEKNGTGAIHSHGLSSRYQYIYSSIVRGHSKGPCGIGFGGSVTQPRLFISESLDYINYVSYDTTFEPYELNPPLLGVSKLDIDCIEIWGVGDDKSLRSLESHRDIRESTLRKARQVDKAAFLGDLRSGLIESKMFDYAQQMRDRDGSCLLDCD